MKSSNLSLITQFFTGFFLLWLLACEGPGADHNTLTSAEKADGWILMFNGENSEGWRGFNRPDFPDNWGVKDGTLYSTGVIGDIIYDQKFLDFHLKLDWKISEGGNSGVFFLIQEIDDRPIWQIAPEIQILDNEAHPDFDPRQIASALYDLFPPTVQNTKPVGEWNTMEIILHGGHLTVRLNNEDVNHAQISTPEWEAKVDDSKFPAEVFAKLEPGYIGVQGHDGDKVWFRNIKIREL